MDCLGKYKHSIKRYLKAGSKAINTIFLKHLMENCSSRIVWFTERTARLGSLEILRAVALRGTPKSSTLFCKENGNRK